MSNNYEKIYETILDVIEPKLEDAGYSRDTVTPDIDLMNVLDSFGVLDAILEIEERTGVNADLGEMEFEDSMTLGKLAKEIVRINI